MSYYPIVSVLKDIHPLDTTKGAAVIELLRNPPSAEKFEDENSWYQHWWDLLLTAASVVPIGKESVVVREGISNADYGNTGSSAPTADSNELEDNEQVAIDLAVSIIGAVIKQKTGSAFTTQVKVTSRTDEAMQLLKSLCTAHLLYLSDTSRENAYALKMVFELAESFLKRDSDG